MHPFSPSVRRLTFAVFAAALLPPAGFAGVVLVEKGVPQADVILPRAATADEKNAADELVRCIERQTGARLAVRTQRLPGRPAVLLCLAAAPEAVQTRLRDLKGDAFVIDASGDTLVLAGKGHDGTSCAVYELLERFAGARWLWPGELGEVIPRRS